MLSILIMMMISWVIKISKLFKLYSINMCHLISVYSSIKLFKNVNTVNMCAQRFPILWDLINNSLPGSSVHEVLQTRILELLPFSPPENRPTQGQNQSLLCLLHWQENFFPLTLPRSPINVIFQEIFIFWFLLSILKLSLKLLYKCIHNFDKAIWNIN